jgi:hypothetical protein
VDILHPENLQTLLNETQDICISIYLPTHSVGREQQQDPIRFKNLLKEARERLKMRTMRQPDIEALLAPAEQLLSDEYFWQHQSDGLAVMISNDIFETFRLPVAFDPLLVIADNFHLKPVLPFMSGNSHFYILALSQNETRLLQGDRFSVSEIDLTNTPNSLREALRFDDPEKQLQFHTETATPGSTDTRPSIYHGQGIVEDDSKTELLRYFQKVDHGMMDFLHGEHAPLVIASVDYLFPIYQEANSYPNLVDDVLTGNPEERSNTDLHQDAWKLVKPIFRQELQDALNRYQELQGSESKLASHHLSEIIPAAYQGQIDVLFVALGVQIWGNYDENEGSIQRHQEFQPGDQDLLDLAAIQTILNGGKVYTLKPEQMPDPNIAAIYRFYYKN